MKQYAIFTITLLSSALIGMDTGMSKSIVPVGRPSRSTAFFGGTSTKELIREVSLLDAKGMVVSQSPFYSDPLVEKALEVARIKKVAVERQAPSAEIARLETKKRKALELEKQRKKQRKKPQMRPAEVVVKGLHNKSFVLASDKENIENAHTVVGVGSNNRSCQSYQNKEVMVITEDDPILSKQVLQGYQDDASTKKLVSPSRRKVLEITPNRPTEIRTLTHSLKSSKALRFDRVFDEPSPDTKFDLATMGFDAPDVVEKVTKGMATIPENRKPQVRLVVDKSALAHADQLQKLEDAGAQVYVFNPRGEWKVYQSNIPQIQHMKVLNRRLADGSTLSVVGSANFVPRSDRERNGEVYYPNDHILHKQLYIGIEKTIRRSERFNPSMAKKSLSIQSSKTSIEDID